jgi:hypothetical protein
MRYLSATALALLVAAQTVNSRAQAPQATISDNSGIIHGTWTAELHNGRAFLQLRSPAPPDRDRRGEGSGDWSMGQTLPIDELQGLPVNDEQLTAGMLRFELRREAGAFTFQGSFRDGQGAGLFTFVPRAEFVAEMKRLGYSDELPPWRRYQLAMHDVGPRYITALTAEGYEKLSLDAVQRAKTHGVTIEFIRGMKGEGYVGGTLDEIVRTRDHGVTPAYVQDMRRAGFGGTAIDDLVRARDHGVTPEFVQEIRGLGLAVPSLDQFVRLRDHGVRAQFVTDLKAAGYDRLGSEDLVRLHDHGVTPSYIRELAAQGYGSLPLEDVVRAKDHGVSAEYVSDMKGLVKDPTLAQLVRLSDHGVTPGFVNHARARGFTTTDPEELVRLKNGGLWRH